MQENEVIKIGDDAPDFVLKDQNGTETRIADQKGKIVLLSFHPLAWTSICADQMRSIDENYHRFEEMDAVPFGLSVDSVPCKKAWAAELGISNLKMLSDFWSHGGVAHAYGIFRDSDGLSERANIIVGRDGNVAFVKVYPMNRLPDIGEILEIMKKMNEE